ncbi:MAG: FAD-dependent oxidoreductase, partial [Vicinamibacterales bacterium]
YVQGVVRDVYDAEPAEALERQGIDVLFGGATFEDAHRVRIGDRAIQARKFLITTGARPSVPSISGLDAVPYLTYDRIFDLDRVPPSLIVIGGGPLGLEIGQAYRRLGAAVTIVAPRLLPKDDPDAAEVIRTVFQREGITLVSGRATSVRQDDGAVVVASDRGDEVRGGSVLVATGRAPNVAGLGLDLAGVQFSERGIPVDDQLRTNVKHIYAAGDVLGQEQFSHVAGWQAFHATRNALLPGGRGARPEPIAWVTFTDPEVAQVGLTEAQATARFGARIRVARWDMSRVDRARCEGDEHGFIKIITTDDSRLVGATIVAARAGEVSAEFSLAIAHGLTAGQIGGSIHAYPTYATAVQQLAGEMATDHWAASVTGRLVRRWLRFRARR